MAAKKLTGGCVCGAVGYEVTDGFRYALNCHCSQCRRATGSAFKPFGGIEVAEFTITQGAENITKRGEVSTHDAFCARCGSLMWSLVRDGQFVHVTYGTLHDAPSLRPAAHIFVGSKAPWYEILDDLP